MFTAIHNKMLTTDILAFVFSLRHVPMATKRTFLGQKGALKLTPTFYARTSGLRLSLARVHTIRSYSTEIHTHYYMQS